MKKTIAILLVLAMVLSMIPLIGAYAAGPCYVAGDFNDWNTSANPMTQDGDIFTATIAITSGWQDYKIVDNGNWLPSDNIWFNADSDCDATFIYNSATGSIGVLGSGIKCYLRGSMNGWGTTEMSPDGLVYKVKVNLEAGTTYEFKVTAYSDSSYDYAWPSSNQSYTATESKEHTFIFDPASKAITVDDGSGIVPDTPDYVVAGSFNSWSNTASSMEDSNAMTTEDDNIYTVDVALSSAGVYAFKVVKNNTWDSPCAKNVAFYVSEADTVTISYNVQTGVVSVAGDHIDNTTHTVHALVPESYTTSVNLWAWENISNTNLADGDWPGNLSMVQDSDGWFTYSIPSWVNSIIILASDASKQSATYTIENGKDLWLDLTADTPAVSYEEPVTYYVSINEGEKQELSLDANGNWSLTVKNVASGNYNADFYKNNTNFGSAMINSVPAGASLVATYNTTTTECSVVYVEHTYSIKVGSNDAADMTLSEGVFIYEFVTAEGGNLSITLLKDSSDFMYHSLTDVVAGSTVTVTYDPADQDEPLTVDVDAPKYYVAGNTDLTGENWVTNSTDNQLQGPQLDGTYCIAYEGLQPNTQYLFKITNGKWASAGGAEWGDNNGNFEFAVSEANAAVTITFNPSDGSVLIEGPITEYQAPSTDEDTYHIVGSGSVFSQEWSVAGGFLMTKGSDGKYTYVFENVAAGELGFKVVKNSNTWIPDGFDNETKATSLAGSTVTVTFDPATSEISVKVDGGTDSDDDDQGGSTTEPVYVVAGEAELCGNAWNTTDANNKMEKQSDGTYKKVYTNVPAGEHELKVVKDGSTWIPDNADNIKVTAKQGATVTVTYNPTTGEVKAVATGGTDQVVIDPNAKYYVAGVKELCGSEWNCADEANLMTVNTSTGTYSITYKDLVPNTRYAFKVTNGTWDKAWPSSDKEFAVAQKGDVTITFNPATGEVTLSANAIKYVPTISDSDKLVVAGTSGLCGSEWNATDANNQLVKGADGSYSITYKNVAKGDYELKVVLNGSTWIGASDGNNVKFTVGEVCDVTVSYTPAGGIVVTGASVTVYVPDVPSNGDETNLMGMVIVMMAAVLGMGVTVLSKKKFF